MDAIRELVYVEDGTVTLRLPAHFHAKRVEVIVLAADDELVGKAQAPLHRRSPSSLLAGTRIVGDIMSPVVDPDQRLPSAVVTEQVDLWLKDNQAALDSSNAFIEKNGLPLAKFRNF